MSNVQTVLNALVPEFPEHSVIAVSIELDLTKHNRDTVYPIIDVVGADFIPAGDFDADPRDPKTFLYQRRLSETALETVVFYSIPPAYPIADVQAWATALAAAPEFNGSITKVQVHMPQSTLN